MANFEISAHSQFCRGKNCPRNHLLNTLFCAQCNQADNRNYRCEKCDNLCVDNSLFCEKHVPIEQLFRSFQNDLMQEIKSITQEINGLKTMMVRMSDHLEIVVSRLDLLEKQ